MQKVSKAILIGLGVLLILSVALLGGLNFYVQSSGARARLQEELSKALRLPIKLTKTNVTPWGDLHITGITIPNGDANFLEAAAFTARYRFLPLFGGKLVITEMSVENPKLLWEESADGKWNLPTSQKAAAISTQEAAAEPAAPANSEKSVKSEARKPKVEKPATFAVEIQRFAIKNGAVELLDSAHKHVAVLTGVNMIYTTLNAERVEGTATIEKVIWADGLTFENARAPFVYANHELSLPEVNATAGGGTLRGKYRAEFGAANTIYEANGQFAQVNLERFSGAPPGGDAPQLRGELDGQFEMRGDTNRPDKVARHGQLDLRNGQFSQLELFQTLGSFLGLRELSDLRVKDGHADLRLSGDKIYVERLLLNTADLQLSAKGIVRLDQRVNLDAQLSVEEAVAKHLPGKMPDSFVADGHGRSAIDFNITGTTDKLKTNLTDKLMAQTINAQFGNLLGSLLGDKKPEDEKKKKEDEERKKADKKADKERKKKDKPAAASAPTPPSQ